MRTVYLALAAAVLLLATCSRSGGPGAVPGQAAVKFCHDLTRNTAKIDLTLEIGPPPLVRLTATTGSCTPPVGTPCTTLTMVGALPTRLLEGETVLASGTLYPRNNGEYWFRAVVDQNTGRPTVRTFQFLPEFKCQLTDPVARPDGGPEAGVGGDGAVDGGGVDGGVDAGGVDATGVDAGGVDATGVDAPGVDSAG